MSATHIIERCGIAGLEVLLEEKKISRVQTHQLLSVAECENCNWSIIGDEKDDTLIKEQAVRHNMITNHRIHAQAMQCNDIKFHQIIQLDDYKKYDSTWGRTVIESDKNLNPQGKPGKMCLQTVFTDGTNRGSKVFDSQAEIRELEGGVHEFIAETAPEMTDIQDNANNETRHDIHNIIIIAIQRRLEINIKGFMGFSFETIKA